MYLLVEGPGAKKAERDNLGQPDGLDCSYRRDGLTVLINKDVIYMANLYLNKEQGSTSLFDGNEFKNISQIV